MTKAQIAVKNTMARLLAEIEEPMTEPETERLIVLLKRVKSNSGWGVAIQMNFQRGLDINIIIEQMTSQAVDDFTGMIGIVGREATILLLRSYPR